MIRRRALGRRGRFLAAVLAIGGATIVCSPREADRDDSVRTALSELTAEQAIVRARLFVVQQNAASHVYLDSAAVTAVDVIWRVTFRRRALVVPAVLTVDVNRHTGDARFAGDE